VRDAGLTALPALDLTTRLTRAVRDVPDFPHPGIVFRDITTLLNDAALFGEAVEAMAALHRNDAVDVVAAVESRGFVLGGAVAHILGAGFVPIRKQGRLPAATISAAYQLEYGEATLEVHTDSVRAGQRVLIVDDLLATGGTAAAAVQLVESLGGVVTGIAFLIELVHLNGAVALAGHDHTSLITL
jgi:adenine phosphoribosyltransferase